MKRLALIAFLLISCLKDFAQKQTDSCTMEISLLTVAPGEDLYSIFGHTAIRVFDKARGMDIVYNYGTFDDTDPQFYVHFTKGIMNYSLSVETFSDFMLEYRYEKREVKAQVLNLNCAAKKAMYEALRENSTEANRFYQYHFHTDNCTTRAGKLIATHTGEPFIFKNILPDPPPTYRDMIHEYLNKQYKYWDEFGIDMMLGVHLDDKPGNEGAIYFLPDYLFKGMDSALNGDKPIVANTKTILQFPDQHQVTGGLMDYLTSPIAVFLFISILYGLTYFSKSSIAKKSLLILDILFYGLLGLVGLLMTTIWIIRIDDVCRDNINVLWALPTHLIAVFFLRSKKGWVKYYFLIAAIIAFILFVGFPWWPQRMNSSIPVLLLIIIIRSYSLFKTRNDEKKHSFQRAVA